MSNPSSDPLAESVADALSDILPGSVEVTYNPTLAFTVRLDDRVGQLTSRERNSLSELLDVVPAAGLDVVERLPRNGGDRPGFSVNSSLRRALRDMVAAEVLARYAATRLGRRVAVDLIADTIGFLIELSGTRVESHDLTHGVIITDVLRNDPRLEFVYPDDVRAAKRAPLLFDGQRAVLVVDPEGRARTELQRHRLNRLSDDADPVAEDEDDMVESGSLVAEATRLVGGLGFFLRADRSIWTFVDGLPLLVRRSEHWTAFPLELTASIENMIGGGSVAGLVARAAFMISARPQGAILAIVDDADDLKGVVPPKDRYDQRAEIGRDEMRPETRLHHLIDAESLDDETLVRLAGLDGATVLDRDGRLLAYGAIVSSADSEHEGARTAAAKTLSEYARVVLKVSVDGDITIFRDGVAVTTLLGRVTDLREDGFSAAGEGLSPPAG